ncbi:hypothetical protein GCM10027044_03040 [Hymenobacter ruber]
MMRLPFTQESDFRQQRDFGQKFSATFEFIGAHWRGLGRALLYIVLPAALLRGVAAAVLQQQMLQETLGAVRSGTRYSPNTAALEQLALMGRMTGTPLYWLNISVSFAFATLLVLTVYSYVKLCMHPAPTDKPIMPGEVWQGVKEHFLGSFLSYFGLAILIIIGFFLLAIPGIYLSVAFSLFFVVKVMEGSGFGATLSRCLQLIKGKWWSTFGLLFIMLFMLGILFAVVGAMAGGLTLGMARGALGTDGANPNFSVLLIVLTTLGGVLNLLIYPPILLAIAFQYFNLVERRDGIGLRHMVDQLGRPPVPVHNTDYRPDDEGEY